MPDLSLATRVAARPDVLSCTVGSDGAVLLDPRAGVYLGVEGPAALMWSTLATGPVSLAELCASVVAAYEVADDTCEADVRVFIDDLLRRDLVALVPDADAGDHEA